MKVVSEPMPLSLHSRSCAFPLSLPEMGTSFPYFGTHPRVVFYIIGRNSAPSPQAKSPVLLGSIYQRRWDILVHQWVPR
jgi:hypothetical protein